MTDNATPEQVEQAISAATEEALRLRLAEIVAPFERENKIWRQTCESLVTFLDVIRDSIRESDGIDSATKDKLSRQINTRLGDLVAELRGL